MGDITISHILLYHNGVLLVIESLPTDINEYKTIWDTLASNPIGTLIIIPVITGILYFCRSIPVKIWNSIWGCLSTEVTVYELNSRDAYQTIEYMLSKYKFRCIISNLIFHKVKYTNNLVLSPGMWTVFYGLIKGMFVTVRRIRDTDNKMDTGFIFYVRFFTRNRNKVRKFLETTAHESMNISIDGTYRLNTSDKWNSEWYTRTKRCVALGSCTKQQISTATIIKDIASKESFEKLGVLLHGCPGGGKTKLVEALASMTGMRIYYVNLGQMDDRELTALMSSAITPSILLFEDIDCVTSAGSRENVEESDDTTGTKRKPLSNVTLSTLLNIFDGVLSLDRQIVIATTNYPDKLDAALRRKGRFDLTIELLPIEHDEICRIGEMYFNVDISEHMRNISKTFEPLPVANVHTACKMADTPEEFCELILSGKSVVD